MCVVVLQLIYGGTGEASQEFAEKLEEGLAVAKLLMFKPADASETELEVPSEQPEDEGSESDEEAGMEQTDALVEIVKLVYGTAQEGQQEPSPERYIGVDT